MSSSFQRGLIATRSGGDIPFSPAQIPDIFCWFRGDRGADIVNGKYVSVVDGAAPEYVFAQSNAARRPDASTWAGKITPVYNRDAIANMAHTASAADWSWLLDGSDWTCIWRCRRDWMGDAYPIIIGTWGAGFFGFRNAGTNDNRIIFYLRSGGAHLTGAMLVNQNPSSPYLTVSVTSKDQVVTLRNNEFERSVAWVPPAEPDFVAGLNIGSAQGVTTSPIPEVIFYRRALTEVELAQLTSYLETEWPETSPIFSMMGNDPDAVIEDDKFVSIPDRGNVTGAVVAQSVVGRRPEVVQWGGDGELCPRFTATNSALGSDRDANDFACLTDGKDDVLITYRYLLEETPYSLLGAFATAPSNNDAGLGGYLSVQVVDGISQAEQIIFRGPSGSTSHNSVRGTISPVSAHTMQEHITRDYIDFYFDGAFTARRNRTDPRHDYATLPLHVGWYATALSLRNPLAAFRIDPGPVSVEMMRGIRAEIEAVYPAVIPRPTIEFDPGTADITADTDGEVSQMATTGTLPVLWTNGGQPGMVWDGQTLTQSVNSQVLSIADKDVTKFLHDGSDFTMAFDTSSVSGYVFYSMSSNNQSTGIATHLQSGLPITLFGNGTIRSFTFIWSQDTHTGGLSIIRLRGKVLQAWYKGVLTQTINLSDYAFSSEASSLQFRIAGSPVDVRWFAIWDRALDDPQVQRLIDIKNS